MFVFSQFFPGSVKYYLNDFLTTFEDFQLIKIPLKLNSELSKFSLKSANLID